MKLEIVYMLTLRVSKHQLTSQKVKK